MIDNINGVKKLIEKYGLKTTNRSRVLAYQRYYLYNQLARHMTRAAIGKLFGRDHSSVVYGISMARLFEYQKDKLYNMYTMEIRQEFEFLKGNKEYFAARCSEYYDGMALIHISLPADRSIMEQMDEVSTLNEFIQVLQCSGVQVYNQ